MTEKPDSGVDAHAEHQFVISLEDLVKSERTYPWLHSLVVGSMVEPYFQYGIERAGQLVRLELRINGQPASLRKGIDGIKANYETAMKAEAKELVERKLQGLLDKIDRIQRLVDDEFRELACYARPGDEG